MKALITGILSIFVVAGIGCTKSKPKNEHGLNPAETLRINLRQEPPSLDWSKSTDTTSALIEYNIMEGLTEYDLKDPELGLIPALATEWKASKEASVWTFKIRENVKWTDGQILTAQHFVDAWERLLNPLTASEYAYFLYSVQGARDYNESKIKDFSKVGVKAIDANTLEVKLKAPKSYFPYLLTHHSTYPIRVDAVKKHGDKWTDPENIITLGAYKMKRWEHDNIIVLERNESYYGEKAKIKNILGYMINEDSTALNLFDAGKIDVLDQLPSREMAQLKKRPEYRKVPILGIFYFGFNTKKPPFDDVRVRKAVSMSIDRSQITKLLAGGQEPLTGWVPAGMFGYEKNAGLEFNPSKAKKMLEEAGIKDLKTLPKVQISFNTNEDHQRVAENVQAQLKKNLGLTIELANEEWKTYLKSVQTDPAGIFRLGWLADYPDPDNFLNLMTSYSENNHTRWEDKEFDSLIEKATAITNKDERRKIYQKAQKILTEKDVPVVPIYSMVSQFLVSPRVVNYPLNSMQKQVLKDVELK